MPWVIVLAVVTTMFGATLRFSTLQTKLFTNDEATTSLRVAGHRTEDYVATFDGRVRSARQIAVTMQGRVPGTTSFDVARALAVEEPQHAPFYYMTERAWQNLAGDSVIARRVLSAVAGVLLIGAVAWLAFELFGSVTSGVAATLVAVSPFQFIYSQQAREYALWSFLVAVVSAILVRALRSNRRRFWVGYAVTAILGLYTESLFLATLLAHGVAIVASRAWRPKFGAFLLASAVAVIAYGPWLWFLLDHARRGGINGIGANKYLETPLPLTVFVIKWLFQIGAVFFDSEFRSPIFAIVMVPVLAIVVISIIRMLKVRVEGTSLVICLLIVPAFILLIPDLLLHESRSTAARYLVPSWIALELVVGWYLADLLVSRSRRSRGIGWAVLSGFVLIGAGACGIQAFSEWSWADGSIRPIGPIARIIDSAVTGDNVPLVVWQAPFGSPTAPGVFDFSVVELSNVVKPDVRFQQFAWTSSVTPAANNGKVFLLNPREDLRQSLQKRGYVLTLIYKDDLIGSGAAAVIHRQTASLRKKVGFADIAFSLWRVERPRQL